MPDEVRACNKIKSLNRLDCIGYTDNVPNGYKGLLSFVNSKGQLFLYRASAPAIVKANSKRVATWILTHGSLNVSSIYLELPEYGYGYPNAKPFLNNGSPNPLFPFRSDAYLFIVNKDISVIELLIIPNEKNMISGYHNQLIDGEFNEEINQLRNDAKPFFKYLPPCPADLDLAL